MMMLYIYIIQDLTMILKNYFFGTIPKADPNRKMT